MRPRESSPFWVWLTIGLMAGGSAAYVTSYFIIEDFMAVFNSEVESVMAIRKI